MTCDAAQWVAEEAEKENAALYEQTCKPLDKIVVREEHVSKSLYQE